MKLAKAPGLSQGQFTADGVSVLIILAAADMIGNHSGTPSGSDSSSDDDVTQNYAKAGKRNRRESKWLAFPRL